MAFVEIERGRRWSGAESSHKDSLVFSLVKSGKNAKGRQRQSLAVNIGESLMRSMRWVVGDRITIKTDDAAALGLVVRVTSGGWKISASGCDDISKATGTVWRGRVNFRPADAAFEKLMPGALVRYDAESVSVTNEGILFALPKAKTPNRIASLVGSNGSH